MAKKYNTDEYKQVTTPANPTGGFNKLYFKADNKAYRLDSTGVETEIGVATLQAVINSATATTTTSTTTATISAIDIVSDGGYPVTEV
jgi:hypothetical protein